MAFHVESACAPALGGFCFTQIPDQFQQAENEQSSQKYACPRFTSRLRDGARWRGAQPLCVRRAGLYIRPSLPLFVSPAVTRVCAGCAVIGNDTGLHGVASERAPLSPRSSAPASRCATGPSKEAVEDKCVPPAVIHDVHASAALWLRLRVAAEASRGGLFAVCVLRPQKLARQL